MSLKNLSTIPGNNTLAPPYGAPESSTKLKDFNDIIRQLMADTRTLAASNTIASAATTDLGSLDETFLTVSGTTTITSFGTVSAGIYKLVTFSGALTLTHNATSLILLTGANRTTVAGDCGLYLSLGGGNWKEYFYSPIGGLQPLDATLTALAGLATGADNLPYSTGADTFSQTPLTAFARTLLDDADAATARTTLGVSQPSLLSTITVSAATTSVEFTGLDIATHKGYRIEVEYKDGATAGHAVYMTVNGLNTLTDYYRQHISADSTTVSSARENNPEIMSVNTVDVMYVTIDLGLSHGYPSANSAVNRNPGAPVRLLNYAWSKTAAVSNITSLQFTSSVANGMAVGTVFRIYRKDV